MRRAAFILSLALLAPAAIHGQQPATTAATPQPAQNDQNTLRISLPVVTVTAEKEPEVAQNAPSALPR